MRGSVPIGRRYGFRGVGGGGVGVSNTPPVVANLVGDWNSYSPAFYALDGASRVQTMLGQNGGTDLTQSTAGKRPAISAAGAPDGVHAAFDFALFAGTATLLGVASLGLTAAVSIYTVMKVQGGTTRCVCDGATGDTRAIFYDGTNLDLYAGSSACGVATTAGTWIVDAAIFNGAGSKHSITGGVAATGNVGIATSAGHTFGCNASGLAAGAFQSLATRQVVYSVAHDDATRALVVAYLRAWSGL